MNYDTCHSGSGKLQASIWNSGKWKEQSGIGQGSTSSEACATKRERKGSRIHVKMRLASAGVVWVLALPKQDNNHQTDIQARLFDIAVLIWWWGHIRGLSKSQCSTLPLVESHSLNRQWKRQLRRCFHPCSYQLSSCSVFSCWSCFAVRRRKKEQENECSLTWAPSMFALETIQKAK